ncbi:MAG TPA: glutaminyl-peptide cyclotransferase [Chitinophagaceae bacterium]|nr:glutaminyl-peptide cyclotransferase [Chitinophagaceae bacterium]
MKRTLCPFLTFFLALTIACNNNTDTTDGTPDPDNPPPATINYTVLNVFPHDTASFTQGLEFYDSILYESTGSPEDYGYPSWLGKINPKTGKMDNKVTLDSQYFGEGLTVLNNKLYLLTWTTKTGFVYDAKTLKKLGQFAYNTEGWGLTHDSTSLIMSDGSSNLYYLDTATFRNTRILGVVDHNGPVSNLNELEYFDGYIYANQWQTNYVLKIDPSSGRVVGRLDLSTLVSEVANKFPGYNYLNGIAYNPASKTVFVTGKRWPNIYEIRF